MDELQRDLDLQRRVTLLDLVDRVLDKGVVVRGEVILAVADVDLVRLDLRLLLGAVDVVGGPADGAVPAKERAG